MKAIQKEAEILGLIVNIIEYINEKNVFLKTLSDVNYIIPKTKILKNASFEIIDMKEGEQLTFITEKNEILTCMVLFGNVIIGTELSRLKKYDNKILNKEALNYDHSDVTILAAISVEDMPSFIPARAACESKLLFISTN